VKIVRQWNLHGHTVGIDHGQGLESMYQHLSRFAVTDGATVKKGDLIGYSGSKGRSNAPHLHWTLYANGVAVNPLEWVKGHFVLGGCRKITSETLKRTPKEQDAFWRRRPRASGGGRTGSAGRP
jgi:murein DD-endopeptidase MepM/ murein hydrolase activator NlpD